MQIKQEVATYLNLCGEIHMNVDSCRTIQPGDVCWLIVRPHWHVLDCMRQTVTSNENLFILELWHEVTESGESPELSESLVIDTSPKALHLRLADMADKGCRSFIASLVSASYWEDQTSKVLSDRTPNCRQAVKAKRTNCVGLYS